MAVDHHMDDATYQRGVSAVWRATMWLGIATVLEVGIALAYFYLPAFQAMPRILLNLFFILATLFKAFFIIAEFMHLKYEKRALIISLGIPITFILWAILAFLIEGGYWFQLRNFVSP